MSAKTRRPTVGPNPAYIRADQERRRSNAGGRHAQGPRRQRSRNAARTAAISDHQ